MHGNNYCGGCQSYRCSCGGGGHHVSHYHYNNPSDPAGPVSNVSEWNVDPDRNTDLAGFHIGPGMKAHVIDDVIREMMAQIARKCSEDGELEDRTHTTSATAPATPSIGDTWLNSDTGITSIRINNGTDDIWLPIDGDFHYDTLQEAIDAEPPLDQVVTVRSHAILGDGGWFEGVVEAAANSFYPDGGPIRPIEWGDDRAWGVVADGISGTMVNDRVNYAPSGTDNTEDLQRYLNFCLVNGYVAKLQKGIVYHNGVYIGHDATANPLPIEADNAASGFTIEGNSSMQISGIQNIDIENPGATVWVMPAGVRTIFRRAGNTTLRRLDIRGSAPGDFLETGNAFIQGGGTENCRFSNYHESAVAEPTVMSSTAHFYGSHKQDFYIGTPNYRDRRNDDSISSDDLYFGAGRRFQPDGAGSLGSIENELALGLRRGWVFGSPFTPGYTGPTGGGVGFRDSSAGFCQNGIVIGAGWSDQDIENCHLEFMAWTGLDVHEGAGLVRYLGGSISGPRRANGDFLRDGLVYIRPGAEKVVIEETIFDFNTQTAVLIQTAPGFPATEVVIKGAYAGDNGGPLVGVIDGGGDLDILIDGPRGPIAANRLVGYVTRGADYTQHGYTQATQLARVVNAPSEWLPLMSVDTDISNQRKVNEYTRVGTQTGDTTITIGGMTDQQSSIFEKWQNPNEMRIAPAPNAVLIEDGIVTQSTDPVPYISRAGRGIITAHFGGIQGGVQRINITRS